MTSLDEAVDDMLDTRVEQPIYGMIPKQTTKPAFRLVKLPPRSVERTFAVADNNGFKFEKRKVDLEGGYLLRAYKGHSMYIANLAELRSRGLDEYVPMINSENDEIEGMVATSAVTTKQSNKAA